MCLHSCVNVIFAGAWSLADRCSARPHHRGMIESWNTILGEEHIQDLARIDLGLRDCQLHRFVVVLGQRNDLRVQPQNAACG